MPRTKHHSIDSYIGTRVRLRRLMLNMSQEQLSARLGVTFQQIQKYEKGTNRISAGRLLELAIALRVPVSFFMTVWTIPIAASAWTACMKKPPLPRFSILFPAAKA